VQIRRKVLETWLHDLRVGWGDRAVRSASAITPIIAIGQIADLHTVGQHFAREGHQLDDVLEWFQLLATHSRVVRQQLSRGGIISLASGWADGVLRDDTADVVSPFEVLRVRVHQQVERAQSLGQAPGAHLALVVVESDGALESARRVAQHARDAFHAGETIAMTPSGKILILVHRAHDARHRAVRLTDAMRHDNQLVGSQIRVWIEPLAMAAEHVDSHLLGLAS
jgi:hypothetical protein